MFTHLEVEPNDLDTKGNTLLIGASHEVKERHIYPSGTEMSILNEKGNMLVLLPSDDLGCGQGLSLSTMHHHD